MKISYKVALLVIAVILIDQITKIWVKSTMILDQSNTILSFFEIKFVENPGMAFSMQLPGQFGKILLSVFRVFAVGFIIYMIRKMIREKSHVGLIYCAALVLAGALGNIIDSAFYGLLFTDSNMRIAEIFPKQGYAGFMEGYVVDMLYFPLFQGNLPNWFPIYGGQHIEFFNAIFNIADAAITTSVFIVLIFQKQLFEVKPVEQNDTATNVEKEEENILPKEII